MHPLPATGWKTGPGSQWNAIGRQEMSCRGDKGMGNQMSQKDLRMAECHGLPPLQWAKRHLVGSAALTSVGEAGRADGKFFVHSSLKPHCLVAKAILGLELIKTKSNPGSAMKEEEHRQRFVDCHATHRPTLLCTAQVGHRHPLTPMPHSTDDDDTQKPTSHVGFYLQQEPPQFASI